MTLAFAAVGFLVEGHLGDLAFLWWASVLAVMIEVTIFPHEFGHAAAAKLLGFTVHAIYIGDGPRIYEGRVFGVRFRWGLWPYGGVVVATLPSKTLLFFRQALMVFAGPGTNLVLGLSALWVTHATTGQWFVGHGPWLLVSAFAWANLFGALINLVPIHSPDGVSMDNDGNLLFGLLFLNQADVERYLLSHEMAATHFAFLDGKYEEAVVISRRMTESNPESFEAWSIFAAGLICVGELQQTRTAAERAFQLEQRSESLDLIASVKAVWAQIVLIADHTQRDWYQAAEHVQWIVDRFPDWTWGRLLQGVVRIRLGEPAEGVEILEKLEQHDFPGGTSARYAWLAFAYAQLGNREQADAASVRARELIDASIPKSLVWPVLEQVEPGKNDSELENRRQVGQAGAE